MEKATTQSQITLAHQEIKKRGVRGLTSQELATLWGVTKKAVQNRFYRKQIHPEIQELRGRQYHGLYSLEQIKKIA